MRELEGSSGVVADLSFSAIDLVDSFYQLEWRGMCEYFALDVVVSAAEVGVFRVWDERLEEWRPTEPAEKLFACFKVLPMGWSWSLFLCQQVLEEQMILSEMGRTGQSRAEVGERVVRDRRPVGRVAPGLPLLAPYVDNANLLAWSPGDATSAVDALGLQLHCVGLVYRVEARGTKSLESVGLWVNGASCRIRNTAKRTWRLHSALTALLRQGRCSGHTMRIVAGRMVHFSLVQRASLSVLEEVWRFADFHGERVADLGPELRAELIVFRGLVPVLTHDAFLEPSPIGFITDASAKGFAMLEGSLDPADVKELSRVKERWRFREVHARATGPWEFATAAQDAEEILFGEDFEEWVLQEAEGELGGKKTQARENGERRHRPAGGRFVEDAVAVPAVPDRVLVPSRWTRVVSGGWMKDEAIHMKEARAAVYALRRSGRRVEGREHVVLVLGDNMSELLAAEKGRAANAALNQMCRRVAGLLVSSGSRWARRHVECGRNIADLDSRWADRGVVDGGESLGGGALRRRLALRGLRDEGGFARTLRSAGHRPRDWRPHVDETSCPFVPRQRVEKGQYFLEIFSGSSHLTGALWEQGLRVAQPVDVKNGARHDVTREAIAATLLSWVKRGSVWCVWMSPPDLPGRAAGAEGRERGDAARGALGSARFCVCMIDECSGRGVPYVIENSNGSRLLRWAPLRSRLARDGATKVCVDMCQFSMPFRRRTTVVGTLAGLGLVISLARVDATGSMCRCAASRRLAATGESCGRRLWPPCIPRVSAEPWLRCARPRPWRRAARAMKTAWQRPGTTSSGARSANRPPTAWKPRAVRGVTKSLGSSASRSRPASSPPSARSSEEQRRAADRLGRAVNRRIRYTAAGRPAVGYLRMQKVSAKTQELYGEASRQFFSVTKLSGSAPVQIVDAELDRSILALYLDGAQLAEARVLFYAVRWRTGATNGELRRSHASLAGFRSSTREPIGEPVMWEAACLMALSAVQNKRRDDAMVAVMMLAQFDLLARPGEMCALDASWVLKIKTEHSSADTMIVFFRATPAPATRRNSKTTRCSWDRSHACSGSASCCVASLRSVDRGRSLG